MEIEATDSSPVKRSGTGEGDRAQRGGGGGHIPTASSLAAPSTMLASARMVPLPRCAGEEPLCERIVAAARAWIGTPYVHQASAKGAGCDCLGLLRGVWREVMGDEPESAPPYSEDWAEARGEETMHAAFKRHFGEIEPTRVAPGDIALFRMLLRGPAKHCAIVAERDGTPTLIHSRANTRVTEEPLTDSWRRKMVFAFRL